MYSEFKSNALKGFKWSFLNKIVTQSLLFTFSVILARILEPNDYGMFAMITVFSNFGMLFKDFGFGQALIYKKDNTKQELDSVYTFNIFIGLILTLVFFLLAPVIADFYQQPKLKDLTKAISAIFLIQSFGLVNFIQLKKKIDFKRLAIIENTSLLSSAIITVILAYYGFGVWSLAMRSIMNITFRTVMLILVSDYKPTFQYDFKVIKDFWKYSFNVSANGFLTYWMRNLDNLMIGKIIGQGALGLYSMAYQIMLLPIRNISNVIKDVLFPSFASINNDINRIRQVYLKVIQSIALITFPLLAGIAIMSDSFVYIVLGDKWEAIIPLLTLLALVAIPQSIFTVNGVIYLNTGRPDIPLKINSISLPIYALGFYIGLKTNGILGLVYAYSIVYVLQVIPLYFYSAKMINLSIKDFIKSLLPVFIAAATMSTSVFSLKTYFNAPTDLVFFVICILAGIITYSIVILLLRKQIGLTDILLERFNHKSSRS